MRYLLIVALCFCTGCVANMTGAGQRSVDDEGKPVKRQLRQITFAIGGGEVQKASGNFHAEADAEGEWLVESLNEAEGVMTPDAMAAIGTILMNYFAMLPQLPPEPPKASPLEGLAPLIGLLSPAP